MSLPANRRKRIIINGKRVTAIDYPASQTNILYQHMTGNFLYPEDPYQVDGLQRATVKHLIKMMLNTGSRQGSAMAARKNLHQLTNKQQETFELEIKRFGGITSMMRQIEDRNSPIVDCFYQGKAKGQYFAWLESNLVFEVAKYLADLDVPALTVHDEFIVPEDMTDAVMECRYTVALDENIYAVS